VYADGYVVPILAFWQMKHIPSRPVSTYGTSKQDKTRQEMKANFLKLLQSPEAWLVANLQMKGITIGHQP